MRCQYEVYHDDMYPEFAPEPIVVRCIERATHHFVTAENAAGEDGYPVKGVREVGHRWACPEHADLMADYEWDGWFDSMYEVRLLRTEVTA